MLGKTEGKRRIRWQRMRWLEGITNSMDMNQQIPGVSVGQQRSHTTTKQKSQEAALSTSEPDSGPHTGAPSRSLWPYDLRNRNSSHLLEDTVKLLLSCLNLNATGYFAIRDLYLQFKPPEVQMGLDPGLWSPLLGILLSAAGKSQFSLHDGAVSLTLIFHFHCFCYYNHK